MNHKCPKDGCNVQCNSSTLACRTHWYQVSPAVRRAVNTTWRSGDLEAYFEARRAAVEELNAPRN
jgi:hypothetical protein